MKIPERLKQQMIFALEDDNEVMTAALDDEDFDKENKRLNRLLIKDHNKVLDKINNGKELTKKDLQLIWDANEIDVNDEINIRGHYKVAVELHKFIGK